MTTHAPRPVHESLHAHSPLETLVRRTSSPRKPSRSALPLTTLVLPGSEEEETSPRRRLGRPPSSPLLHTRFRTSTGTNSSFNTSIDVLNRSHDRSASQAISFDDDASVYSTEPSSPHKFNNTISVDAMGAYAALPGTLIPHLRLEPRFVSSLLSARAQRTTVLGEMVVGGQQFLSAGLGV
jgi:hypothetical protein